VAKVEKGYENGPSVQSEKSRKPDIHPYSTGMLLTGLFFGPVPSTVQIDIYNTVT